MMWPFNKKQKEPTFSEKVSELIVEHSDEVELSDVFYSFESDIRLRGLQDFDIEKPEKPDWYNRKWEICCSGNYMYEYSIKCDGKYVKDSGFYHRKVAATFVDIHHARQTMYRLIDRDIRKDAAMRRKDETVETWP